MSIRSGSQGPPRLASRSAWDGPLLSAQRKNAPQIITPDTPLTLEERWRLYRKRRLAARKAVETRYDRAYANGYAQWLIAQVDAGKIILPGEGEDSGADAAT